jgi:short-subunit dehydrogenase involved in D-alanine esterification of teichoic acids
VSKTNEIRNLDHFKEEIDMNLLTPIHLIRAFLPLVQKSSSKKILVVSSQLGSIEIGFQMKNLCNAYAVAKAGLNIRFRVCYYLAQVGC